jgi:hypothetical protein
MSAGAPAFFNACEQALVGPVVDGTGGITTEDSMIYIIDMNGKWYPTVWSHNHRRPGRLVPPYLRVDDPQFTFMNGDPYRLALVPRSFAIAANYMSTIIRRGEAGLSVLSLEEAEAHIRDGQGDLGHLSQALLWAQLMPLFKPDSKYISKETVIAGPKKTDLATAAFSVSYNPFLISVSPRLLALWDVSIAMDTDRAARVARLPAVTITPTQPDPRY